LTRYSLRERDPALHVTDASIVAGLRDLFITLRKGSVGARAMVRINNNNNEARTPALTPHSES